MATKMKQVTAVNISLNGVDGTIYLLKHPRPEGNFLFSGDDDNEVIVQVPEEAMATLTQFLAYLNGAGYTVELRDNPDKLDEQGRQLED